MKRSAIAFACCFFFSAGAAISASSASMGGKTGAASEAVVRGPSIEQRVPELLRAGRYLAAMTVMEQALAAGAKDHVKSSFRQLRPSLDGYVVAAEATPDCRSGDQLKLLTRYEGAVASDAVREIVERAKRTRVVILNETHDNPRDRAFVLAVAKALRPLGYNVYAAEGFTNFRGPQGEPLPQRLISDGYARLDTGFYMADPMFAHLVRSVLEMGFRPLPYEHVSTPEEFASMESLSVEESVARREQGQAENLAKAIAAARSEEKFLIHAGYSHAAEKPLVNGTNRREWMALRLTRLTGIDPLTIDQTQVTEFAGGPLQCLYVGLEPRVGTRAKVFLKGGDAVVTGQYDGAVDLQVMHPRIRTVGGRPDWLRNTGRRAVAVPSKLLPKRGRVLVQAYNSTDAIDAVPVDQALVTAGKTPPLIYVPASGTVRWSVQTE